MAEEEIKGRREVKTGMGRCDLVCSRNFEEVSERVLVENVETSDGFDSRGSNLGCFIYFGTCLEDLKAVNNMSLEQKKVT